MLKGGKPGTSQLLKYCLLKYTMELALGIFHNKFKLSCTQNISINLLFFVLDFADEFWFLNF